MGLDQLHNFLQQLRVARHRAEVRNDFLQRDGDADVRVVGIVVEDDDRNHEGRLSAAGALPQRILRSALPACFYQVDGLGSLVALARGGGPLLTPTLHASAADVNRADAPIVTLLDSGCPSAIAGLVRAVIVYAVKRCSWRTIAHVTIKGREVIAPVIRHANSAASIPRKGIVILAVAAFLGGLPAFVLARPGACVRRQPDGVRSSLQAAAAFHDTAAQPVASGFDFEAAVASATPSRFRIVNIRSVKNGEASEPPPSKADHGSHVTILRCVGVDAKR